MSPESLKEFFPNCSNSVVEDKDFVQTAYGKTLTTVLGVVDFCCCMELKRLKGRLVRLQSPDRNKLKVPLYQAMTSLLSQM